MISVIIPAYNSSGTLRRTLQSVLAQTYRDLEVIVVDDGSKDDTAVIGRRIAEADPRVKVFSIPNGGAYRARMYGVEQSSGELLAFCDADDTMPAEAISSLFDGMEPGCDLVVGTLNLNNRGIYRHRVQGLIDYESYISAILLEKTSVGPCAKLYRRKLFNPDELTMDCAIHQHEDLLMLIRLARHAEGIKILPDKVVYNYIYRSGGLSHQRRPLTEWFTLFSILEQDLSEMPALLPDLTVLKVRRMYTEGVLKLNDFKSVRPQLRTLWEEANSVNMEPADQALLSLVYSPTRRRFVGMRHITWLRFKNFVKSILGREG